MTAASAIAAQRHRRPDGDGAHFGARRRASATIARLHLAETGEAPLLCPVNEVSSVAW
jgi:hypothetical protein